MKLEWRKHHDELYSTMHGTIEVYLTVAGVWVARKMSKRDNDGNRRMLKHIGSYSATADEMMEAIQQQNDSFCGL